VARLPPNHEPRAPNPEPRAPNFQCRLTAVLPALRGIRLVPFLIALVCVMGCQREQTPAKPTIEFTSIPNAMEGGPQAVTTIAGRVTGARPGQRIVLFARSGVWWVQPLKLQPFTVIEADGTWKNQTHFGLEYAAMLVENTYRPPATFDLLPEAAGPVLAIATTKGVPNPTFTRKTLQFSGYEWEVRQSVSERGGTINYHDASNAFTDADGRLHMRITPRDGGGWNSAELILTRGLGYGTYMAVVRDTSKLESAAVFSMFTWDEAGADPNHREMDIEISKWGDPKNKNGQFVVQPYHVPANVARFSVPSGLLTHAFRWEPGRVLFRTLRGEVTTATAGRPVFERLFTSGVPSPGGETVRLSLYVFVHTEHPLQNGTEVIVEKFVYLP
jgi:hypothetical protein